MRHFALTFAALLCAAPLLAQAPASGGMLISPAELNEILEDPSLVVLQVADSQATFDEGHIPGARFVRYVDFAIDGDGLGSELPPAETIKRVFEAAGVSDDSRIVLYAPTPVAAARAFFTLDAFGHRRVALLDGGLRAWREAKLPIQTGPRPQASGPGRDRFTPRLNAERVATAAFIQQQFPGKTIALVDVRPDAEFFGTNGAIHGIYAPGHIAGARQLTWNSLVGNDGKFLPREQLKERLESAGVVTGRPVVSYCLVGMRASVVYFVARHLGYDARLYDGSIVDWSRRKLPVTKNE